MMKIEYMTREQIVSDAGLNIYRSPRIKEKVSDLSMLLISMAFDPCL